MSHEIITKNPKRFAIWISSIRWRDHTVTLISRRITDYSDVHQGCQCKWSTTDIHCYIRKFRQRSASTIDNILKQDKNYILAASLDLITKPLFGSYRPPMIEFILSATVLGATIATVVPLSKMALIDVATVVFLEPKVKTTLSATNSQ